jgi:hypothetical protein
VVAKYSDRKEFSMSKQSVELERKPEIPPVNSAEGPSVVPYYADRPPDEKEVAELAYRRWVEKGYPQQSAEDDWFEAERELQLQKPNGR